MAIGQPQCILTDQAGSPEKIFRALIPPEKKTQASQPKILAPASHKIPTPPAKKPKSIVRGIKSSITRFAKGEISESRQK